MTEVQAEAERTMRVYVSNAVRTSAGAFIGWQELPVAEANALIADRRASTVSPEDVLNAEIRQSAGLMAPRRAS
jgi:hypothetical protein